MKRMSKMSLSRIIYSAGGGILFLLAVVCLVAFFKAVSAREVAKEKMQKPLADSLQLEQLRLEVNDLKTKVDSLIILNQKEPQIKYKYMKPHKDSCVIELNVNKKVDTNLYNRE